MYWINVSPRHGLSRSAVRRAAAAEAQWQPSVDIAEQEESYLLSMDIPGVDPSSVEIEMHEGVLSISGERKLTMPASSSYSLQERQDGRFERRFRLPNNADADQIKANSEHGVLQVVIPKRSPRKITVTH